MQKPSVGRIVHYVSYGTPGGEYASQCRAAIVAAVGRADGDIAVDLVVLNPTGLFFNRCAQDEERKAGGTWHWPERVGEIAPVMTEPGCQHPSCVLEHPHAGPALLGRVAE